MSKTSNTKRAKKTTKTKANTKKKTSAKGSTSKGKTKKTATNDKTTTSQPKPRTKRTRLSALAAAAEVLKQAGKPMRTQELIATMAERGLWTSPGGRTPHATLYAAMMREARDKGNASRFRKVDRGQFAFNG